MDEKIGAKLFPSGRSAMMAAGLLGIRLHPSGESIKIVHGVPDWKPGNGRPAKVFNQEDRHIYYWISAKQGWHRAAPFLHRGRSFAWNLPRAPTLQEVMDQWRRNIA